MVKNVARFLSESEILALKQVDISAPAQYEALYSPMIATVGLFGPLPRSDNPLQDTCTLETCQTSMMCGQKVRPEFGQILDPGEFSP